MKETVFGDDVNRMSTFTPVGDVAQDITRKAGERIGQVVLKGGLIMSLQRLQHATMSYSLEDVGRAGSHFCEVGESRIPSVEDACALNAWPQARACFIEFVEAIAKPGEVPKDDPIWSMGAVA